MAAAALLAVAFAALVVLFTGFAAFILQLFRRPANRAQSTPAAARPRSAVTTDDAIEVVTTKVPDETAGRQ